MLSERKRKKGNERKIDKLKSKGISPKKTDFLTRNKQFVAKHKYEFMIDR